MRGLEKCVQIHPRFCYVTHHMRGLEIDTWQSQFEAVVTHHMRGLEM